MLDSAFHRNEVAEEISHERVESIGIFRQDGTEVKGINESAKKSGQAVKP
jgi:hypothetical protein